MKKLLALFLAVLMLAGTITLPVFAADTTYYLKADDFAANPGTWKILSPELDSYFKVLRGLTKGGTASPAMVTIEIEEPGEYTLWVRSRDYVGGTDAKGVPLTSGTRNFKLGINGTIFPTVLGKAGVNGWGWEKAGSMQLEKGANTIYVVDTTMYYARIEAFALTTDKNFKGSDDKATLEKALKENAPKILPTPDSAKNIELKQGEAQKPDNSKTGTVAADDPDRAPSKFELKDTYNYFVINPEHFKEDLGGWSITKDSIAQIGSYFNGGKKTGQLASMKLVLPKNGIYSIWARTKDAPTQGGSRHITLAVDKIPLNKVGVHGIDGWEWEKAGKIELSAGDHTLTVEHTGSYGRMDMILITDDPSFTPPWENSILADWRTNKAYDASKITPDFSNVDDGRPDADIAVKFNGTYMNFDVDPILLNDRTMVPMRAIFEALGCKVSWNDESQTATGVRNGRTVSVTIDSNKAKIAGEHVTIDQSAVLINDRTLVPLRFVSEAYGATVTWNDDTQTVSIMADPVPNAILLLSSNFSQLGDWKFYNDHVQGVTSGEGKTEAEIAAMNLKPAKATFAIDKAGKYNVWVYSRDYATNQPGSRFFHASVDGQKSDVKFGAHGKDGFHWDLAGTYDLSVGSHAVELLDTSAFYARCGGIFVTDDLNYTPSDSIESVKKIASAYDPFAEYAPAPYPEWAKTVGTDIRSDSIENENTKIVFYQQNGPKGTFVQDEIYVKNNGTWVKVKDRAEETGYLMVSAYKTAYAGYGDDAAENAQMFAQSILLNGEVLTTNLGNFYKAGDSAWLIASDFTKVSDTQAVLTYQTDKATVTATYSFDSLCKDPKVELKASFLQDGAYSFLIYSGNGVEEAQFDTVTAPLLYVKHYVPAKDILIAENNMFTPMNTLYYAADNNIKTPGMPLTSGIVVDPTYVEQDFVYPNTANFGAIFRTTDGLVRSQIAAPLFGTEKANFKTGDTYSFAYRIVNDFNGWEDTYKRVNTEMYNYTDLRTNYYTSINEALYNTIKLLKDDYYGGWDKKGMGNYNIEGKNLVTISNPQAFAQTYLWSDDEQFLEERIIPAIAFTLSRGSFHITTKGTDAAKYQGGELGKEIPAFGSNVYGGLYEMSQGRTPYLLDYALNGVSTENVTNNIAKYKYTKDEAYKKAAIAAADEYIKTNPNAGDNRDKRFVAGFVYSDYIIMVDTFLDAYEFTGDQKYLEEAKKAGFMLATGTWTTGYQNDYATTNYQIDPEKVYGRALPFDNASFFWHGDFQWRPGNELGKYYNSRQMEKVEAETVPGWLPAKAGFGTEHVRTPNHGNVITMNNWTGAFLRLAEYTGEDYFRTMANNANIGRFGTYPGYYIDRYITHQMKPEYPYEGPDYTSIYWHHVPVFLGILQDYLFNLAWSRSHGAIDFEGTSQSGYAYFNNYCYGQTPGKFYDTDNMYLWITDGIIDTNNNVNIDYICGRKDGTLAIALMNEDQKALTETIKLGEKVPGGSTFTGKAALYDENGTKTEIDVVNGAFTVTIPVRSIQTVILDIPGVTKPAWATDYTYSNALGETVSNHTNGKGYLLQFNDNAYYAYLFANPNQETTQKVEFAYTVNGKTETVSVNEWPFETIIKVDDVNAPLTYTVTATDNSGKATSMGGGTLKTLKQTGTQPKITIGSGPAVSGAALDLDFAPIAIKYTAQGTGNGKIRLVVPKEQFPFELSADLLKGLPIRGTFTEISTGKAIPFESTLAGNEMRSDGGTTLLVNPTKEIPTKDYDNGKAKTHTIELTLYPAGK